MDFLFSYIVLAEIYVLLGLSTNLLVGIAGIFSVSQAAVFGVGAYIVAHFLMATAALSFVPSRKRSCPQFPGAGVLPVVSRLEVKVMGWPAVPRALIAPLVTVRFLPASK